MRKPALFLLLLLLIPGLAQIQAAGTRRVMPRRVAPENGSITPSNLRVAYPPYAQPQRQINAVDIIGDTLTVGRTWWDWQHNGEIGRMIAKDSLGYIHITWTDASDASASERHIYYNAVDPAGALVFPIGQTRVDQAQRAGYSCLGVARDGRAYVAFHQQTGPVYAHSAIAMDVIPHAGAFTPIEIPWYLGLETNEFIWPKMAMIHNDTLLQVSRDYNSTIPYNQTWDMGMTNTGTFALTFTPQQLTEPTTYEIAHSVGASRVSNKVCVAYTADALAGTTWSVPGNDIHAVIDDDGLNLNFSNWINVTNFIPPDTSLMPDTLAADKDTLRALMDVNVFFDQNNFCHLTFTTIAWLTIEGGLTYTNSSSMIWTWSEQYPSEFHVVARDWDNAPSVELGWNNVRVQRPSMGQNTTTGNLYCAYWRMDTDTSHIAASGYASGEVYISMSTDNGRSWSVGTNVTNTITPNHAHVGQCWSECFPSMAEVVDNYCHLTYIVDKDAGNWSGGGGQGVGTLNPVIYHKVPVSAIPSTPLMQGTPFHVGGTGVQPGQNPSGLPGSFTLEQNSPNPFNPSTGIRFSLRSQGDVTLSVYNLSGQKVATLVRGVYAPGTHSVTFDAAHLASGIYIYRLQVGDQSLQKKMLLVK